ncbi:hypothetical protein [Cupriavidus metallidurans]|uniref:hypothetical protein n=1 Tax=Cupriavidus metallidurans TaxID=119219 RepID=UPI001CCB6826|nr:hypothetical protein [Cupriavidus metallidurans]UBM12808.1 hypothetical protein LAI70_28045 [Cupriavidus metallidurans]
MDVNSLRRLLASQSDDTLRMMNTEIVAELRKRQGLKQQRAMIEIQIGEVYEFYAAKKGCNVRVRVKQVNRTTVTATELDARGRETFMSWRVSPSLLKPAEEPLAA